MPFGWHAKAELSGGLVGTHVARIGWRIGVGINFNFCDLRYANSEIYPDPRNSFTACYAGLEILCTAMTAPRV
jgi:hypothetical protein